jgi:DNA polymerase-3 subunit epsilon
MKKGTKLDHEHALALLERADRIVAHNASGDQSLLASELPGIANAKWLCTYRGIDWKRLIDVRSAGLEVLLRRIGQRHTQEHHAKADADDLKRLLAEKHDGGRTYLGRLLESDET